MTSDADLKPRKAGGAVQTGPQENRPKILVIDDDPRIGRVIGRVATELGFATVATDSPAAFREAVASQPFAAVVLDLNMPGMDGVEVLRELAQLKLTSPVLLTSGVAPKVLETARHLGVGYGLTMVGVLPKPFRAKELIAILGPLVAQASEITEAAVEQGIDAEEMTLHYQPKMDLRTGCIVGVEGLIRWNHTTRGQLAPADFIGVAEAGPVMHKLTNWVLATGVAQLGAWRKKGLDLEVALNVSARSVGDLGLPDYIGTLCRQNDVEPSKVTLELTETASAQEPLRMLDCLTRFRIKGFRLAIDDFGTGYSSLSQLQKLPFSEMKVDKSFVTRMDSSHDCNVITTAIIQLAHSLNMVAVSEGVESRKVLKALSERGCDLAQGYTISRPIPAQGVPDFARFNRMAF